MAVRSADTVFAADATRTPRQCSPRGRRSAASARIGSVLRARLIRRLGARRLRLPDPVLAPSAEHMRTTEPPLLEAEAGHFIRCYVPLGELRQSRVENPPDPMEAPHYTEYRSPPTRAPAPGPG